MFTTQVVLGIKGGQEAIEDLNKVLAVEPDNELAKVSTESNPSPNSIVCFFWVYVKIPALLDK